MEHGYFQNKLSAYHDRSLTPEEMRMMEEHVPGCAECRKQLEMLARLDKLVDEKGALGESDYWETAAHKIESRLGFDRETEVTDLRRSWTGLGWKLAAAAATVAALTFVALHEGDILQSTKERSDQPVQFTKPAAPASYAPTAVDTASRESAYQETYGAEKKNRADRSLNPTRVGATETETREAVEEQTAEATRLYAERPETGTEPLPKSAAGQETPTVRPNGAGAEPETGDAEMKVTADDKVTPPPPVTSAGELLPPSSDMTVDAAGDVAVRGGRAGEAIIPVETSSALDMKDASDSLGRLMGQMRAAGDTAPAAVPPVDKPVSEGLAVEPRARQQVVVSRETLVVADETGSLDHWRSVRDSLQRLIELDDVRLGLSAEKSARSAERPARAASAPSVSVLDSLSDQPTALERYLEAWYRIALLTDDESEHDRAVAVLTEHAEREASPARELSRRYLDSLSTHRE